MRNADHQWTPEQRSYSGDQLYSSVPGGIHQPCNKNHKNLDYGGFLCQVHKFAWATPEKKEKQVLLLGMCEISTLWKESTRSLQEALAFALRLGIFSLSCQESTLQQVEQNGKCKHSCTLKSENLDNTYDKCKPPEKIICFTPDVKPRFQNLGSDQKIVMDVESLCEEASTVDRPSSHILKRSVNRLKSSSATLPDFVPRQRSTEKRRPAWLERRTYLAKQLRNRPRGAIS